MPLTSAEKMRRWRSNPLNAARERIARKEWDKVTEARRGPRKRKPKSVIVSITAAREGTRE